MGGYHPPAYNHSFFAMRKTSLILRSALNKTPPPLKVEANVATRFVQNPYKRTIVGDDNEIQIITNHEQKFFEFLQGSTKLKS